MITFLEEVAEEIFIREKDKLSECCLVFPGRRAALFFTKYLSVHLEKPVWAPTFMTITDLMIKISNCRLADPLKLVFHLYRVYKTQVPRPENFDDFYSFGEVLLNDFNDIDKNLVNAQDLFRNLASLKSLDDQYDYLSRDQREMISRFWSNFEESRRSPEKDKFVSLWEVLYSIYKEFNNRLISSGIIYEGQAYRKVSEMVTHSMTLDIPCRKIYFIGFNALTKSEKVLLKYLEKTGKAEFFWDYDISYVESEVKHEAGHFISEKLRDFRSVQTRGGNEHLLKEKKYIESIAAPTDPGQVKVMSHILSGLKDQDKFHSNNTAVVLADEFLLVPVINSIPEDFKDINITMGYPVKDTPVFSLVESLIDLQKNLKEGKDMIRFYYKDVLRVLDHQYIAYLNIDELKKLRDDIVLQNRILPDKDFLHVNELANTIFQKITDPYGMSEYLREILFQVYVLNSSDDKNDPDKFDLQKEYIYHVYLAINRLKDLLSSEEQPLIVETYLRLLKKIIRGMTISFTGEPLKGLQVMGVLETRAIDFENVILLSLNEGVFPGRGTSLSVIPYNLRRGFGLPTPEYQDRIYAYYFYRLIQRARHITFIYNTKTDGIKTGEVSRFLYQLKYLLRMPIVEKGLAVMVHQQQERKIMIEKSSDEMTVMSKFISGGRSYMSPSALNVYLDCSLKFYFRYVAEIREPEEVAEEVDYLVFGNLLHMTMKILYEGFKTDEIKREQIEKILGDEKFIRKALDDSIRKEWLKTESDTVGEGRNLIAKEILFRYVKQILKVDLKLVPFMIKGLEKEFVREMEINNNGKKVNVKLGGKIDRIDQVNGKLRIIDYKTGMVNKKFTAVEKLFERGWHNRSSEAFQTLIYCWLFDKTDPVNPTIPGLYDIRGMYDEGFSPEFLMNRIKITDFRDLKEEMEANLQELLEEIFNINIPFQQVSEPNICKRCPYNNICKLED